MRLAAVALLAALAACEKPSSPKPVDTTPPVDTTNVDALLGCPTAAEVASINADFVLTFTMDPTSGLTCTAASGSADLTLFKTRIYQALLITKRIPFDTAFPWTTLSLYDWLDAAITGITFDVTSGGYCCSPAGVIHITASANSCAISGGVMNRWIASGMPCGLDATIAVIAHEARHAEGPPHTCGTNDNTIAELGAWGAQYHLLRMFAQHTGTFLTPKTGLPNPDFYRTTAQTQATNTCANRFCNEGCPP